jgi:hypothetical protein
MKLIDLEPKWLAPDLFIFKNPTGGKYWLSCKRIQMTMSEQLKMFYEDHPENVGKVIIHTKPEYAWKFEGNDFTTLTVTPSIDASASGNWHGFISNGNIM